MNNEIECYGLHIKLSDFNNVIHNQKLMDIMDKYDAAAVAMSKNPMLYCASLVFKNQSDRNGALKAMKDIGIHAVLEKEPAFVDRKYEKQSWLDAEGKDEQIHRRGCCR